MKSRAFTGWHMATILIAFFGVVISVNLVMARFAMGTFGGTVVDNSYVASQRYNGWIAEAERQDRLNWEAKATLDRDRRVRLHFTGQGATPAATAFARHPLGQAPDVALDFRADGADGLVSSTPLPDGRWRVHVAARRGDAVRRSLADLQ